MIPVARALPAWTLMALATVGLMAGCGEPTEVEPTPEGVIEPQAVDETPGTEADADADAKAEAEAETLLSAPEPEAEAEAESIAPEPAAEPAPEPEPTAEPEPEASPEPETASAEPTAAEANVEGVELTPVSFEELKTRIAENDAKYTLVDCWASWCGPCKENFPHVVKMAGEYGDDGLKVIALSFDAGTGEENFDASQIKAAKQFLAEQKTDKLTTYRLDEEQVAMFEKFNISTIPAVFIYDADGNEVKRYTWDDPNNQFTYEQVEREVANLLGLSTESNDAAADSSETTE